MGHDSVCRLLIRCRVEPIAWWWMKMNDVRRRDAVDDLHHTENYFVTTAFFVDRYPRLDLLQNLYPLVSPILCSIYPFRDKNSTKEKGYCKMIYLAFETTLQLCHNILFKVHIEIKVEPSWHWTVMSRDIYHFSKRRRQHGSFNTPRIHSKGDSVSLVNKVIVQDKGLRGSLAQYWLKPEKCQRHRGFHARHSAVLQRGST
jgi:hypothetical protein